MYTSANTDTLIGRFEAIGLQQLNAKAAMLERLDNKYVVKAPEVEAFLQSALQHFDALDLNGVRQFRYDTLYYDSQALECFHDHQRGRRKRCKVRVRDYIDTRQCFLEVKLKDKRGSTVKKRMRCALDGQKELTDEQTCFIGYCYRELYDDVWPLELKPVLDMTYQRMTLVAKAGGERLTIDNGLRFAGGGQHVSISEQVYVIETKSRNGNGLADTLLRRLHQHPVNRCSKYCVGVALTHPTVTNNTFKSTIRRLMT